MVSHVVVIWVNEPTGENTDKVLEAADRLLATIPGVHAFHAGRMFPTDRPVVDKSYHIALNMQFDTMEELAQYQIHPQHVEIVEKELKPRLAKLLVYDFNN